MDKFNFIDLFSGIGGFSYAAERIVGGYKTTQFVEIDPYCQSVLRKNFPNTPIHDDIKTFTAKRGEFDVLTAGFPCQDLSVAGRQKGIGEGTLNSKIPEAHTDYIISVISEEFGIVVILLIMLSFIFFAYNIFKKIRDTNENVFKMILTGLISLLLIQAFVHVGVNLRVLPTTGMTLPFLSYGGSSIISISIISGIILNLTKRRVTN